MSQLLKRVRSRTTKPAKKAIVPRVTGLEMPDTMAGEVLALAAPNLAWQWPLSMRQHFYQILRYQSALVVHDAAVDTRMLVFAVVVEHVLAHKLRLDQSGASSALVQVAAPSKTIAQRVCLSLTMALNYKRLHGVHGLHPSKQASDYIKLESIDEAPHRIAIELRFVVPAQLERPRTANDSLIVVGAEKLFANAYFVRGALDPRLSFGVADAHVCALFGVSSEVTASASFAYRAHPQVFMPITESHGADERKFARVACGVLKLADVKMYAGLVCVPPEDSRLGPDGGGARARANTITLGLKPMVLAPNPPPNALSPRAHQRATARSALLSPRRAAPAPPRHEHPSLPPTPSPGCSVPSTSSDGERSESPPPPPPPTLSPMRFTAPLTRTKARPGTIYVGGGFSASTRAHTLDYRMIESIDFD